MDIYTTSFCLPRNAASWHSGKTTTALDQQRGHSHNQSQSSISAAAALNGSNGATSRPSSISSTTDSPADIHAPSTPFNENQNQTNGRNRSPSSTTHAAGSNGDSLPHLNGKDFGTAGTRRSTSSGITTANDGATSATTNGTAASTQDGGRTGATSVTSAAANGPTSAAAARATQELTDAMQRLCVDSMAAHQCMVSFSKVDLPSVSTGSNRNSLGSFAGESRGDESANSQQSFQQSSKLSSSAPQTQPVSNGPATNGILGLPDGKAFNFHLSGGYPHVMSARGAILRDSPFKRKSVVKVPRAEVLDVKESVKAEMRRKLDEIASLTKAHLAIVGQVTGSIGFGLETERNVEIVITGAYESVEQARVRLLVLLDELSGLHSEFCEIDYKLHNIIAGRKRCVIQTIQEETGTNIYFPSPLSGVLGAKVPALLAKQNLIFITGEFFGVQRARDMLFQVSMHKSKCIISRDTAILPRKLDWMLSERLEEIKQTMNDNGTFVNFPVIGSQTSLISVYGDHRVNIERTIRSIMQLACQFYVASFWLLPVSFDVFMPPPTINPSQVPAILKHIAITSGAEAVFKSNCFELHGLESEVRAAILLVLELDIVKAFHHEIRFQIELANEHREFISGKKNGKLNKVMKTAGVKVKFETFNDYNFLIDIAGSDIGALEGLTMLQEELPAEISFHVPGIYHKRIIGVGGKNIQRIMKKYGVYVKFSNAEEFAALGGYLDNEDNVVARTPAKNAFNLEHLKQSVMEMVTPKDKDFVTETVAIPRRYHRTLLGEKSIFIHDIENKTNSIFRFPNKESASDVVTIFGPESQIHIAAQMLLVHIPFEAEFRLPHSSEMAALTLTPDWMSLCERIKHDLNIMVLPWVDRSGGGEETILRFCLNRSSVDFLGTARDLVEDYLVSREITMYPGSNRPRSDSIAEHFIHFNSALLSTGTANGKSGRPIEGATSYEPSFGHQRETSSASTRASNPNTDIKALFDGPERSAYAVNNGHAHVHGRPTPFYTPSMPMAAPPSFSPSPYPMHAGLHQPQVPYQQLTPPAGPMQPWSMYSAPSRGLPGHHDPYVQQGPHYDQYRPPTEELSGMMKNFGFN